MRNIAIYATIGGVAGVLLSRISGPVSVYVLASAYLAISAFNLVNHWRPGPPNTKRYSIRFAMSGYTMIELSDEEMHLKWDRADVPRPRVTPLRGWRTRREELVAFLCQAEDGEKASVLDFKDANVLNWIAGPMFVANSENVHRSKEPGLALFRKLAHDWELAVGGVPAWFGEPPQHVSVVDLRCKTCSIRRIDVSSGGKLNYVFTPEDDTPVGTIRVWGLFLVQSQRTQSPKLPAFPR